jgi:hypothetical protein
VIKGMIKTRKGIKRLILLHDGGGWHAGVRVDNDTWEVAREVAHRADFLPESLLEWGVARGAVQVRVAVPSALYELEVDVEGLSLLSPAELYQTLSFELAEPSGLEAESIAPAVVPCSLLGMGERGARLMGAAFDRELVQEYHRSCEKMGLRFGGLVSLQLLAMATHARSKEPREALLFMGRKDSFVVGYASDEPTASYRAVAMACPDEQRTDEYEHRLGRRIKSYLQEPLHLIVPDDSLLEAEACLRSIQDTVTLRVSGIRDSVSAWMELLSAAVSHPFEDPAGLVGLPPKEKGANYTGGVICVSTIATAALVLGLLSGVKMYQKKSLEKLRQEISTLETAQKSAESAFTSVKNELDRVRSLHGSLSSAPPKVADHYTEIITALAETLPEYSRIDRVAQVGNGVTVIEGRTAWPQELSGFTVALQRELTRFQLRVIPKRMKPEGKTSTTFFVVEVR